MLLNNIKPINNTIKKILIGKLFMFPNSKAVYVIVGLRRNYTHGYLEMLVGRYYGYSISICSWYCYYPKHDMVFVGRGTKQAIRHCLKKNPSYINYHIGKQIDITKIPIHDNCNRYNDYLNKL